MEEKSRYATKICALLVVIILTLLILIGTLSFNEKLSTELNWHFWVEGPVIKADCVFDKELLINQDAMIKISFTEWEFGENYTVSLEPSDGLTIKNNFNWTGNFTQPQYLFYNLSVEVPGYYSISVRLTPELQFRHYDTDIIYFEVTDTKMIIDSRPRNNWYHPNYGGTTRPMPSINENLTGNMTLSKTPYMNEEVLLTYTFNTSIDILDSGRTQLMLIFPSMGFEIIDVVYPPNGETWEAYTDQYIQFTWMGEIRKYETYQISAKFRVIDEGKGNIVCSLVAQTQEGIDKTLKERNSVHLEVNKYTAVYKISD